MRKPQVTGEVGIDSLRLADAPVPEPGEGKIKVRVTALSLNHRGLTMAKLATPGTPLPPLFARCVGDRITALFLQRLVAP